jgi:hypothetical protein
MAADYFVSPDGNDNNAGTSVSAPWRTIARANTRVRAGDTVHLRGGEYVDDPISPTASGTAQGSITYTAYQNERPVLTSYTVLGLEHAIFLQDVSYIIIERIAINGRAPAPAATVGQFATLLNVERAEIRDCDFRYADGWSGIALGNTRFSRIIRNRIDFVGEYDRNGDDWGDSIWVESDSHNNLIASNFITRGAHDLMRTKGHSNIVQDNVLDNDWSSVTGPGTGGHNIIFDGNRNVFQRNVVRGTGTSIDSPRNPGMKVEGISNIARFNLIVDNHDVAIATETGHWQEFAQDNRIYNNTIYNNGGAAWRIRYYTQGPPRRNVFKNNLVYRNRRDPGDAPYDTDIWILLAGAGFNAPGDNVIVNNLIVTTSAGDARVYVDPPSAILPLRDAESRFPDRIGGNIQALPVFVRAQPISFADFELAPGSPGFDAAGPLTTTVAAGSGSTVAVVDASYFVDGHGMIAGDVLRIGSERNVTVLGIDITANVLTVDRAISWAGGAAVNLEFLGSAPDIGAVESGRGRPATNAPRPPVLTRAIVK